ncbi:MAG TPA: hypothetical protein VF285_07450 [Castellaniella sp.]|uniref:hypothetical protein n=1 Tax=Castellaniella sp. TaxID=1955812 RepID=UPI002EDF18E6
MSNTSPDTMKTQSTTPTVGFLSALPGAESQLQSHMRISLNVGLTAKQLEQAVRVLSAQVGGT